MSNVGGIGPSSQMGGVEGIKGPEELPQGTEAAELQGPKSDMNKLQKTADEQGQGDKVRQLLEQGMAMMALTTMQAAEKNRAAQRKLEERGR
jgi:hypothetical protein